MRQTPRLMTYAGIGTRHLRKGEKTRIEKWAAWLKQKGYVCISGNADGADIAFQQGSRGSCYIMLPFPNFNKAMYNYEIPGSCIQACNVGETSEGLHSVDKYHPAPDRLTQGARALMARNYHQVCGLWTEGGAVLVPAADFVMCCADESSDGQVLGGTGQAARIAHHMGIPVFNMRRPGFRDAFLVWWEGRKA